VYQVYIRTTPEKLWRAITDGTMTKQYFFGGVLQNGDRLAVGAPMIYLDEDGDSITDGIVLEIDAPRKLVHTFIATHRPEAERDPASRVTWEIMPLGDACKLTVVHEHADETTETATGTVRGWPMILSCLKTLVETGTPLEITLPETATA
jgi:uncharacterized protein YndB with AHSA1/START domain